MRTISSIPEMRILSEKLRREGQCVGFVPTMGALHDGHLGLVRSCVQECTTTVVSIFVNPTQFGPGEDLDQYPRTPESDARLLEDQGCDILLILEKEQMYPKGFQSWVEVKLLTENLCGAHRPGHFKGVTTVVAKLFNIVRPHRAYFGWKDAQQLLIIRRMVEDLNFEIEISGLPTVRDQDGLALSSRNRYLTEEERENALLIPEAIHRAREYFQKGGRNAKLLLKELNALFEERTDTRVDYISLVRMDDLEDTDEITRETLLALAVKVGSTRLIDNHRFAEDEPCSER